MTEKNRLSFGDCLDILKKIHTDNSKGIFDLIYIDPPFNSKRNYNIFFESANTPGATAQKEAFQDTWTSVAYIDTRNEIHKLHSDLYDYLKVLDKININQSNVAYLTIIAHRIYYIHKVLKDTGNFYLHCDPNMSHYLKTVCDLIFGYKNFRNEIVWCYQTGGAGKRNYSKKHDVILFYSKNGKYKFYPQSILDKRTEKSLKRAQNPKGARISKDNTTKNPADVFNIQALNPMAKERLGYPTQKPEALLERIIKASSKEGDLVGDFFCGCGTTVATAQKLNRQWMGVDISSLAIGLIRKRLTAGHTIQEQEKILDNIQIDGFPKDILSAKELAQNVNKGRFLFQDWIIQGMLNGVSNPKKTGDGGYDGHIVFIVNKESQSILIEVKSGNTNIGDIRGFIHVLQREEAAMGVFVCFEDHVTPGMKREIKTSGYYNEELFDQRHPKIQILTVEAILKNQTINMPSVQNITFKSAAKAKPQWDDKQKTF